MKSANFRTFCDSMEDLSHDIVRACRRAARTIVAMPWPAMLVCCIGLALVISILPLAFFLFVVFMAVKVVVGAFVIDARSRSQGSRPHAYKRYEQ
jgi:hypothetical protein